MSLPLLCNMTSLLQLEFWNKHIAKKIIMSLMFSFRATLYLTIMRYVSGPLFSQFAWTLSSSGLMDLSMGIVVNRLELWLN